MCATPSLIAACSSAALATERCSCAAAAAAAASAASDSRRATCGMVRCIVCCDASVTGPPSSRYCASMAVGQPAVLVRSGVHVKRHVNTSTSLHSVDVVARALRVLRRSAMRPTKLCRGVLAPKQVPCHCSDVPRVSRAHSMACVQLTIMLDTAPFKTFASGVLAASLEISHRCREALAARDTNKPALCARRRHKRPLVAAGTDLAVETAIKGDTWCEVPTRPATCSATHVAAAADLLASMMPRPASLIAAPLQFKLLKWITRPCSARPSWWTHAAASTGAQALLQAKTLSDKADRSSPPCHAASETFRRAMYDVPAGRPRCCASVCNMGAKACLAGGIPRE